MTYQRSRKYITVMKTLDSSVKHCKIDQCLKKHLEHRFYHSRIVLASVAKQLKHNDVQNAVRNCGALNKEQPATLTATRRLEELVDNLGQSHNLAICHCDIHGNTMDVEGSDTQTETQIFEENKDRSQTSGNPTQCKFQKLNSQSCKCFFPMPSHIKLLRTSQQHYRNRYIGSSTQSQRNSSRHFSSSSQSGPEFVVRQEPPWRVLFFGTDQISVETLKRLHGNM